MPFTISTPPLPSSSSIMRSSSLVLAGLAPQHIVRTTHSATYFAREAKRRASSAMWRFWREDSRPSTAHHLLWLRCCCLRAGGSPSIVASAVAPSALVLFSGVYRKHPAPAPAEQQRHHIQDHDVVYEEQQGLRRHSGGPGGADRISGLNRLAAAWRDHPCT